MVPYNKNKAIIARARHALLEMSTLHFISQRLRPNSRALLAALALFLLSVVLLAYAGNWYAGQLLLERQTATREELRGYAQSLAAGLNANLSRIQGLLGFVSIAEEGDAMWADFQEFAAGIVLGTEGIRYMVVAPDGMVQHVFASDDSQALLAQDLARELAPEVRAAVERAVMTEEAVLAGPLIFPDGRLGLIGTRAVYHDRRYWGLVQIAVDLEPLLDDLDNRAATSPLELALRDNEGQVFLGSYTLFARAPVFVEVPVAEERWTLAAIPQGGWQAAIGDDLFLARAAGLLVAVLLATIVYLTVDRQQRLAVAVQRRTQELAEAHQLLEERVKERTRELQTLLDVSRNVASTLDFPSLLSLLLDQMQEVVDFDRLAVYLVREEGRLELQQYHGQQQGKPQRSALPSDFMDLREPLIIDDAHSHGPALQQWRRLAGERPEHGASTPGPAMLVPLLLKERLLGVLVFEHRVPHTYTARHGELAIAMANHVAVAIENARLYEQAHSLAALQERQKLARELHDSVSQALYGISLGVHTALGLLGQDEAGPEPAALRQPLDYSLSLARAAQAEMRALIFELRPESLEVEGLLPALVRMAEALQARHDLQIQTSFEAEPDLSVAHKEVLYRVAQEALNNVVKHARANRATVALAVVKGDVVLEITDDGVGFDPQGDYPGHLGLQSMRERMEEAGGALQVESNPGKGAVVRATLPGPPD